MKEVFKNDGKPKVILQRQMLVIINKDNIISESYFGGMGITVTANGDLDVIYPDVIAHPSIIPANQSDWSTTAAAINEFKNRVVKAAAPETTNEEAPENTNPEFKHQDDSDYWDWDSSESEETKTDAATENDNDNKENLPVEYIETPYAKAVSLIEDFIKEYEECSEIPTHSGDLYDTECGYNGVYFNSKISHAPYHFRMMVENDPKVNTIYLCFDPRKRHSVYKAATQRVGGDDNGAYTCRLTFSTGSAYKRLLAPGDISGWGIHNKDISDLLKDIKELFDASEIESDAFGGKEYSI